MVRRALTCLRERPPLALHATRRPICSRRPPPSGSRVAPPRPTRPTRSVRRSLAGDGGTSRVRARLSSPAGACARRHTGPGPRQWAHPLPASLLHLRRAGHPRAGRGRWQRHAIGRRARDRVSPAARGTPRPWRASGQPWRVSGSPAACKQAAQSGRGCGGPGGHASSAQPAAPRAHPRPVATAAWTRPKPQASLLRHSRSPIPPGAGAARGACRGVGVGARELRGRKSAAPNPTAGTSTRATAQPRGIRMAARPRIFATGRPATSRRAAGNAGDARNARALTAVSFAERTPHRDAGPAAPQRPRIPPAAVVPRSRAMPTTTTAAGCAQPPQAPSRCSCRRHTSPARPGRAWPRLGPP
jgi:hypothetical protein